MNDLFSSLKTAKLVEFISKEQENKKARRLSEIGFTLLVIAAFAFFALKPTFATISDLMGKINSKQLLVVEMDKKIRATVQAQDNFAKIQNDYPLIQSCIPDRPAFYQATTQVQKSGETNNVIIDKISFNLATDPDEKNIDSYHMTVTTQGDFINFLNTLNKINKSRRPFKMENFGFTLPKLQSSAATASASGVNFTMNAKFYYLEKDNVKK